MTLKSRFCPSPTGYIHLGNARTALFSALAAHKEKGCFLLRIEDTDLQRSEEKYSLALQEDLIWLGCQWDEGPGLEKGHEPYYQAQRHHIYEHYYQQLLSQGLAYPCFCSEEKLETTRRIQRKLGQAPRYDGACRHLSQNEVNKKIEENIPFALRFYVKDKTMIEFDDKVRGHQVFSSEDLGDFIIKKSDGSASFMFCNAIDDALMGVNLALRGEDHLTNTPRQILILKALGLRVPEYGHLSLIMGNDGSPLSKRNGSHSIQDLRAAGFLPLAIVNYLARLGHVYIDHNELMSFSECANYFDLARLVKAAAQYDEKQLLHWQKEAVLQLSLLELRAWVGEEILQVVPKEKQEAFLKIVQMNSLFPKEVLAWAQAFFSDDLIFSEQALSVLRMAGQDFFSKTYDLLNTMDTYSACCDALKESLGVKGKALFMPLRIALMQREQGPELAAVFELMGKEGIQKRIHLLKKYL